MIEFAKRVQELPPYLFAQISRKIAEKRAQGVDVISFGVGDPDLPTPPHIIDALVEAARDPANHHHTTPVDQRHFLGPTVPFQSGENRHR